MHKIIEELQQKIIAIDNDRDEREQQYYRDKLKISTEYTTMDTALLNQKFYLKWLLKIVEDELVEKNTI